MTTLADPPAVTIKSANDTLRIRRSVDPAGISVVDVSGQPVGVLWSLKALDAAAAFRSAAHDHDVRLMKNALAEVRKAFEELRQRRAADVETIHQLQAAVTARNAQIQLLADALARERTKGIEAPPVSRPPTADAASQAAKLEITVLTNTVPTRTQYLRDGAGELAESVTRPATEDE